MYHQASDEFKKQMDHVKANYGAEHFNSAKSNMIWYELKGYSPKQIASIFSTLLGENAFAFGIKEVREVVGRLRDKIRREERILEIQEAKDTWDGTYHDDTTKYRFSMIRKRIMGHVPDEEWNQFMSTLPR